MREIPVNIDAGGEPDFEERRGFESGTITPRGELRINIFGYWWSLRLPLETMTIVYEEG